MIGINAVSGVLYYLFYFPPTFSMKFSNRDKLQQLKGLDFVGLFLFTAGLLLFLMGLSWGGSVSKRISNSKTIF
jgi:Fungal trichothecene efflux pump (TRI12)